MVLGQSAQPAIEWTAIHKLKIAVEKAMYDNNWEV
jgi:hypothetical protein